MSTEIFTQLQIYLITTNCFGWAEWKGYILGLVYKKIHRFKKNGRFVLMLLFRN